MPRKRWTARTEISPSLIKFREKKKWQINLRRYVIQQTPCPAYAPYFALDIQNLRKWFEIQLLPGLGWDDFGKKWQFDHLVPVTLFDFSVTADLKLCWNFTNLRVELIPNKKNRGNRIDILAAKGYFESLYKKTGYWVCKRLIRKIELLELSEFVSTENQVSFIMEKQDYLKTIETYASFEFELLNSGRDFDEVKKEIEFLRTWQK